MEEGTLQRDGTHTTPPTTNQRSKNVTLAHFHFTSVNGKWKVVTGLANGTGQTESLKAQLKTRPFLGKFRPVKALSHLDQSGLKIGGKIGIF